MMEALEKLKSIERNQPSDGTAQIYDGEYFKFENGEYYRWASVSDIQDWYADSEPSSDARLMSGIRITIELMEAQNNLSNRIALMKEKYKKLR